MLRNWMPTLLLTALTAGTTLGCGEQDQPPTAQADGVDERPAQAAQPATNGEEIVATVDVALPTAAQPRTVPPLGEAIPATFDEAIAPATLGAPASDALDAVPIGPPPATSAAEEEEEAALTSQPELTDIAIAPIVPDTQAEGTSGEEADGDSPPPRSKEPKDFVALNGPVFENWQPPVAALLISGEQLGYIEPCGCAGLENQKGGLARRHTLIRSLTEQGWPLARIDLGAQIRRFGTQSEIKFRVSTNALAQLGYGAVGFGPQDLRLTAEEILGVALNLPGGESAFVAANVEFADLGDLFVQPYRVLQTGPQRIVVTAIVGKNYQAQVNNPDLKFNDPAASLAKIVPQMRKEGDLLVLLAHATPDETRALAKAFPQFHLVVTAGAAEEPPILPETVDGARNWLIEVGHKGMYVAVIGIYDQPKPTLRYQRVPIDGRFADSPEMKEVMRRYQSELETLGLAGLGLLRDGAATRPHPSGHRFQGSQACADCHSSAHAVWEETPHAHATQTLVDLDPPRHFDPECLSCHVTGWEPQQFVPLTGGYLGLKATPELRANGCENCHGPAAEHAQVELGEVQADAAMREQLRAALRMKLEPGEAEGTVVGTVTQSCLKCHDLDNSPEFNFKTYWPEVVHEGKD